MIHFKKLKYYYTKDRRREYELIFRKDTLLVILIKYYGFEGLEG